MNQSISLRQSRITGYHPFIIHGDKQTIASNDTSHTASNIGSLNGNVSIKAGKDYTQTGSNITTPAGDIDIAAQEVTIQEVQNTGKSHSETKFEQSGLTLSLSNAVVDAANTVEQQGKAGGKTSSNRMKALSVANALMSANNAADAVTEGATGDLAGKVGGINVNLSVGGSTSESSTTQTYSTAQGSNVTAGGNINITALSPNPSPASGRGGSEAEGEGEGAGKGNITLQGSNIKAGNNTTLEADNDINLLAAKSTAEQHSTNSSSSGSIGVGISVTGKGGGLTGTASASAARGNADGSDVTWTNTHVDAGNTLTLKSGNNTNLKGAVASGKEVVADIGGNLNIESLQDTSTYDSKQTSRGGSLSVAIIGSGSGGSVNAADTNITSNYASVMEQSGIKAGDGGFKVKVKGNTDLKGAIIFSTDKAIEDGKNSLTTGTFTASDIENKAEAGANSSGINLGSDMFTEGKYGVSKGVIGNALNNGEASGSSSGHTLSALSGGVVIITDETKQIGLTGKGAQETVAILNRDTSNTQVAAQRLDVQAMAQTADAERAIRQEAIKQGAILTDAVHKAITADKKIILQRCDQEGQCSTKQVDAKDVKVVDGKVQVFNNGIFNTEEDALANAKKQNSAQANSQGVYVVINPYTGNAISEVLYAGWDKTLAPTLGISNASEANIDILNAAAQQGGMVEIIGHSRGGITIENATGQMRADGVTNAPISNVQLNGSAGNAQNVQSNINQITSGQGQVYQSTHQNDLVSTLIGGNPATGGLPSGFGDAHSNYGPNADPRRMEKVWGPGQISQSLPVNSAR